MIEEYNLKKNVQKSFSDIQSCDAEADIQQYRD